MPQKHSTKKRTPFCQSKSRRSYSKQQSEAKRRLGFYVLEPQEYTRVTVLTSSSDMIKEELFYDAALVPGGSHSFPVSGSGADQWYVVKNPSLWPDRKIPRKLSDQLGEGEDVPSPNLRLLTWQDILALKPSYQIN